MNILSRIFNSDSKKRSNIIVGYTDEVEKTIYELLKHPVYNKVLYESISTFHTCCKILSEDIASFPLKIYKNYEDGNREVLKDDYRYFPLHREPNPYTTHYDFFSPVEYLRNKNGNVFIDIKVDTSDIKPKLILKLVQTGDIDTSKYKIEGNQLYYWDNRIKDWNNSSNYLHFKMLSDGIFGIDPTVPLSQNLGISYKALKTIDGFYENGGIGSTFFETMIPEGINAKSWIQSQEDYKTKYAGWKKAFADKWLPPFVKPTTVSLNLTDSQFIETIKFNANQICSFYKISPDRIGNYESTKYNDLKQSTLSYKIYTLRPILRMYREEFERKLLSREEILDGISIEFNAKGLLETDDKERMTNLKEAFGMGAITPNYICKTEGYPTFPEGDKHYLFNQLRDIEKSPAISIPSSQI